MILESPWSSEVYLIWPMYMLILARNIVSLSVSNE